MIPLAPRICSGLALMLTLSALAPGSSAASVTRGGRNDDPWLALLARVPDQPEYRSSVVLNDYEAARDAVEIEGTGDDRRDLARLTIEAGMPVSELVETAAERGDPLREELGIPVGSIARDLTAGEPPDEFVVLDGNVRRDRVERAVEQDETWSDLLRRRRHAGQEYLAWDGEDVHFDRRSPVRSVGVGGRLAVDPPLAVWTRTTAAIEGSLEASNGDVRSLADDATITRATSLLRDHAYAMFLTDTPSAAGVDPGGAEPLVTPLMTALGAGGESPTLLIVLAQATPAEAKENARRLGQIVARGTSVTKKRPWRDLVEVEDISTEGSFVVAILRADSPDLWLDVAFARDSLLASS